MDKLSKPKIYLVSNACEGRSSDTSRLVNYFILNGCSMIRNPKKADYIIFITCGYIAPIQQESFQAIKKLQRYRAELIIAGCLGDIAATRFNNEYKGRYISTKKLNEIDSLFKNFRIKFSDVASDGYLHHAISLKDHDQPEILKFYQKILKHATQKINGLKRRLLAIFGIKKIPGRYFLHVSRGCLGNCAYCAIRNAVGTLKSKPLDTCIAEYKKLVGKGCRHLTLLGDYIGTYGLDFNSSFSSLLENLSSVDKDVDVKWEIPFIRPDYLIKHKTALSRLIKQGKIVKIGCQIQSGSKRILTLMNRYSDIDAIANTLLEFKKDGPALIISTVIIIGFPSETEEDFLATLNIIKKVKFHYVAICPYHDEEGTISSKMDNKTDKETIKERIKRAFRFFKQEKIESATDIKL